MKVLLVLLAALLNSHSLNAGVLFDSHTNESESQLQHESIECYWCNSRDVHCSKRVTDTIIPTVRCPKNSRCMLYTNPYDNYYLHRGCSSSMDFSTASIENGCFLEEDGSIYCFCDFNRCNSASIYELRNLDASNDTTTTTTITPSQTPETTTSQTPETTTTITTEKSVLLDDSLIANKTIQEIRNFIQTQQANQKPYIPFKNIVNAFTADRKQLQNKLQPATKNESIQLVEKQTTSRPTAEPTTTTTEQQPKPLVAQPLSTNFKCPSEGLFVHPQNCSKFVQCVYYGSVHETSYTFDCPARLHFNEKKGYCDYPDNVKCQTN